jgi:hypothetical protein
VERAAAGLVKPNDGRRPNAKGGTARKGDAPISHYVGQGGHAASASGSSAVATAGSAVDASALSASMAAFQCEAMGPVEVKS